MTTDKRKYFRLKNGVKVIYKSVGKFGEYKSEALDVGGGGLLLPANERLEKGTPLELSLNLPQDKDAFFALARVAWQSPNAKKNDAGRLYYETGVEFLKMNLKDRLQIIHYVHSGLSKKMDDL
ncbi:MAG: PilZ domain-containing protein [Candidatus Omnitrophica bacterium]|nr:PilZ domain-containing protein [Candidatus Omnitrophota bacterium]